MDTNRIYTLSEQADKYFLNNEPIPNELINELKSLLTDGGYIGLAQLNPMVGNIEYNSKKIAKYIKYAESISLDTIVFPELALVGFPMEDTLNRHPILAKECLKWLNGIAKITGNTKAIVGFIEPSVNGKFYNSVAILQNGEIKDIIRKSTIPAFSDFNDYKYIEPSNLCSNLYEGYKISIGEDYLNYNDKEEKIDLFINCSAQTAKNEEKVKTSLSSISKKYNIPYVYVNQVGTIDNFSFNGASLVYNSEGELIARAKSFEEQLLIVNPEKSIGKVYPLPIKQSQNVFTFDYESDLERVYKTIIQGIKDYFNKCGLKRAVLGLSGGLDSTVCAVLLTDALGKDNVYGISMPSHITSSESMSDAEQLAHNLGIHYAIAPIGSMFDTTKETLNKAFDAIETNWNCRYKASFTQDNIQARSRATILWGISNEFESCIPIATSDKSEAYMGYATINGDMSGGFAPIADITKTKLFALARWLNKNRKEKNAIPEAIILKKPGAELAINPKTGKPLAAEDALMPYEFLDEIIWRIENKNESYDDFLEIEFIYEKRNRVSKEQKIEWLDKFYRRMSTAFYKWSIMPPSIIVEEHSINGHVYKQPITSGKINYKKVSEEYINQALG